MKWSWRFEHKCLRTCFYKCSACIIIRSPVFLLFRFIKLRCLNFTFLSNSKAPSRSKGTSTFIRFCALIFAIAACKSIKLTVDKMGPEHLYFVWCWSSKPRLQKSNWRDTGSEAGNSDNKTPFSKSSLNWSCKNDPKHFFSNEPGKRSAKISNRLVLTLGVFSHKHSESTKMLRIAKLTTRLSFYNNFCN